MDLAKRLSEELAAQQAKQSGSLGLNRALSPDTEPRSRSYEQQQHKSKGLECDTLSILNNINSSKQLKINSSSIQLNVISSTPLHHIDSATNELPLSAIDFSMNPLTPETLISDPLEHSISSLSLYKNDTRAHMSPLATNERPLSCTCLNTIGSSDPRIAEILLVPSVINSNNINPIPIFSLNDSILNSRKCFSCSELRMYMRPFLSSEQLYHNTYSADIFPTSCSAPAALDVDYCFSNNNNQSLALDPRNNYNLNCSNFNNNGSQLIFDSKQSYALSYLENINDDISNQFIEPITEITSQSQFTNVDSLITPSDSTASPSFVSSQFPPHSIDGKSSSSCGSPINASFAATSTAQSNMIRVTITKTPPLPISPPNRTANNSPTLSFLNPSLSFSCTNFDPITPHPKFDKLHNPDTTTSSTSSSASASARRQRHGIAGQMSYFKMLGFGGFGKKMATSTNSLFSTAVISGSSSAPNLRDMIPSTATPSVLEGFGGVPPIRPLETLHNALSLKQLDSFLEKMTVAPLFKTPASSPPKYPSTPVPTPVQTPQSTTNEKTGAGPSSFNFSEHSVSS